MGIVAILGLILAVLVMRGRWRGRMSAQVRRLQTTVLLVGGGAVAAIFAVRGEFALAAICAGAALLLWIVGGRRATPKAAPADPKDAAARGLLGVGPRAGREEIVRAHRRLMRQAHPDVGGTAELAARLNAARDLLLGA